MSSLIETLPPERQGLPLIVTVGRLSRIKGMDRVVEAWAKDPELSTQFNLMVVGGNLDVPTWEECRTLRMLEKALGGRPPTEAGLILIGNRSHADISRILAAVVSGIGNLVAPGGIYVCGSEKEEFGLAILEAMAAGLPVVAPLVGGPSTYVDHMFTGYLADATEVDELRKGIKWAATARFSEVRADTARKLVRDHFSLTAMADSLVEMYDSVERNRKAM
jgi:glycosyltransferase involved in cell wall biosynthesis